MIFKFAEKYFQSCPLTPACTVWCLFKHIQETMLLHKWKPWVTCSGERLNTLCFWSAKEEKEATDTDLEPNRIGLELSETNQNAFGESYFSQVSFHPISSPGTSALQAFLLQRAMMPRLCLQRKQCCLPYRVLAKISQVSLTLLFKLIVTSPHTVKKRWVVSRALTSHISGKKNRKKVFLSPPLYKTCFTLYFFWI